VSAIGPSSAIAQAAISVVRSSLSCANLSIVLILSDFCWDYGRGVDRTPRPSCTIATISLFVDRLESLPIAILVQAINCDDYTIKQRKAQIKQRTKQKNDAQKLE
jgi:hypothetical protein